jgi:hypothetical protein
MHVYMYAYVCTSGRVTVMLTLARRARVLSVLDRRKETRKRGLFFHTPVMVPLSPHIRLVQDDPSYVSLVRGSAQRITRHRTGCLVRDVAFSLSLFLCLYLGLVVCDADGADAAAGLLRGGQEEVYEDHCVRTNMATDAPILLFHERLRAFLATRAAQVAAQVRPRPVLRANVHVLSFCACASVCVSAFAVLDQLLIMACVHRARRARRRASHTRWSS